MELNAEQVKKALECCNSEGHICGKCPYESVRIGISCRDKLIRDARSLINSQEHRIKELTEKFNAGNKEYIRLDNEYRSLNAKYIKLTEENEAWQKSLITQKENADKAYYELACEVGDLGAENERLKAENARYEAENHAQFDKWLKLEEATKRHHSELFEEAKIVVKEDTVRKMQDRLKIYFGTYALSYKIPLSEALKAVNQIAKEMLGDKPCT